MNERFRIGELARRCAVSRDTIRFYERVGLLPRPRRTASRHRLYDGKAEEQIRFVRHSQLLGLSLSDIRGLLPLRDGAGSMAARRASEILGARLDHCEKRIEEFVAFRDRLKEALRRCRDGSPGGCQLLVDLSKESPAFPDNVEAIRRVARGIAGD